MTMVATWNMGRRSHIAEYWAFVDNICDVALLQECVPPGTPTPNVAFSMATGRTAFGTAVASRHALSDERPLVGSEGRAVMACVPALSNLKCVSVHNVPVAEKGGNYPKAALNVITAIEKAVDFRADTPVIVGGDWNSSVHFKWKNFAPVFERFIALGLDDVACIQARCARKEPCRLIHEPTLFREDKRFRIDYLFVNAAAASRLRQVKVLPQRLDSDHAPILADFDL